jgi:hypothetical protein
MNFGRVSAPDVEMARRGAADRRGRVDGATAAIARAWAYGVIQML